MLPSELLSKTGKLRSQLLHVLMHMAFLIQLFETLYVIRKGGEYQRKEVELEEEKAEMVEMEEHIVASEYEKKRGVKRKKSFESLPDEDPKSQVRKSVRLRSANFPLKLK